MNLEKFYQNELKEVMYMSILELHKVCYHYEQSTKEVLYQIQAEFDQGNVYTIVGKSGAGKSTLLSLISGLDIATEGEIYCNGESLRKMDRDRYRAESIGVIFQGYNLLTNATAIDNVVLAMHISKSKVKNKKEYAYELLRRVGIQRETANRKVLKLSGGEQQRVGIARALSHDPGIIIADEPTGNLDAETEADIMQILQDLAHQEQKCVLIVTHSKGVSQYADICYQLKAGKLSLVNQAMGD